MAVLGMTTKEKRKCTCYKSWVVSRNDFSL